MYKIFFVIQLILVLSLVIYPQTQSTVVQKNWQRYKITNQNVSIAFPKLPGLEVNTDNCNDIVSKNYATYQNGVVYGFKVTAKTNPDVKNNCTNIVKFDENSFSNYLKKLIGTNEGIIITINERETVKLIIKDSTYWLINDYPNKRWFEFWVVGANDEKKEVADFLASLKFNVSNTDTEINDGAEKTIGDENVVNVEGKVGTTRLNIALKPPARYTDVARQNQVQGIVTLRVTFLANGGIGSVEVVNGLPDGMTEQVVKAANKIVFIPPSKDGVFYTVTKQFQYSFTFY